MGDREETWAAAFEFTSTFVCAAFELTATHYALRRPHIERGLKGI